MSLTATTGTTARIVWTGIARADVPETVKHAIIVFVKKTKLSVPASVSVVAMSLETAQIMRSYVLIVKTATRMVSVWTMDGHARDVRLVIAQEIARTIIMPRNAIAKRVTSASMGYVFPMVFALLINVAITGHV